MAYIALAPALKNPPIGIVLAGNDGPNLAAAICATFGCREWKTPSGLMRENPMTNSTVPWLKPAGPWSCGPKSDR